MREAGLDGSMLPRLFRFVVLFICVCAAPGLRAQSPPPFSVLPTSLNFGDVVVGVARFLTLRITPVVGFASVDFTVASTNPAFTVSPTKFSSVQPVTVSVTFLPTAPGPVSGQINITGNGIAVGSGVGPVLAPVTVLVPVSGNGIPLFALSPASIDFGDVVVNTPSSRTFTVTPNVNSSFTLSSTNPAFRVSPASFSGASPQTITVTFTPTAVGPFSPFSGNIQVTGQAQSPGSTPLTLFVGVTGTGVTAFGVSPATLNFGSVLVGASSSLTFTVTPRTLVAFTLTATDPAFSITPPSFVSAAQQTITVTFSPARAGPVNGQIAVTGDPVVIAVVALHPDAVLVPATLRVNATGTGVTAFGTSPSSLDFGGVLLSCSASQSFTVTPAADLGFSLSSDNAAFVPDPTAFSGPNTQSVMVTFNPAASGPNSGAIVVRASRSGQPVDSDTVPVSGLGADLVLSPATVDFVGISVGGSSRRTVTYSTNPPINASFSARASSTNPAFTASASSQPGQIDITFAPRADGPASDTVTVVFTRQDTGFTPCSVTRTIAVRGTAVPAGSIAVFPPALEFSAKAGNPLQEQRTVAITSPQLADLRWIAEVSGGTPSWLRITPSGGAVPGTLAVQADTTGLGPGVVQAEILVTPRPAAAALAAEGGGEVSQSAPARFSVRLTVTQQSPLLVVAPTVLSLVGAEGSSSRLRRALVIANGGGASLSWTARTETVDGRSWLSIDPSSGAAPSSATAVADLTGLAAGVYQGRIRFRSGSQEVVVAVTLLVSRFGGRLSTDRAGLLFETIEGADRLPAQQFEVLNIGTGSVSWIADLPDSPRWLAISPAAGTSNASDLRGSPRVTVTANAGGLRAGVYSALVRLQSISALNTPQFVTAILHVLRAGSDPPLEVRPGGILFVAAGGGAAPAPQPIEIQIGSPQDVSFRAAATTFSGGSWLTVTPASASASASRSVSLQVRADSRNLSSGVYQGQVAVALAHGDMRSTQVTLLVTQPGTTLTRPVVPQAISARLPDQAACFPAKLLVTATVLAGGFTARAGWPALIEVHVTDDCGTPIDTAAVLTVFSNGDPPLPMTGQGDGVYRGTWVSSQTTSQVNVRTLALAPGLTQGEAVVVGTVSENVFPMISKNGIVNGASFEAGGPLAPGGIVSLFGANLGTGNFVATTTPLASVLGDVRLAVAGRATPLFFSSPGQINAQLPFELAPATQLQVVVLAAGQYTIPETITTVNAHPGIFILDPSFGGPGRAVAQNLDFTLNTPANPVDRGSAIILYLTGQGPVAPAVATGAAAPSTQPFATATLPAEASIQGRKAEIVFLGLTPGLVGLLQAVVRVPADTVAGSAVPVSITIAGQPSNTLGISVK